MKNLKINKILVADRDFDQETRKLYLVGSNRQPAWAAKIEGKDPKYGFKRSFLDKEYEGRALAFELEEGGLYEWEESRDRHFGIVEDGKLYEISKPDMVNLAELI